MLSLAFLVAIISLGWASTRYDRFMFFLAINGFISLIFVLILPKLLVANDGLLRNTLTAAESEFIGEKCLSIMGVVPNIVDEDPHLAEKLALIVHLILLGLASSCGGLLWQRSPFVGLLLMCAYISLFAHDPLFMRFDSTRISLVIALLGTGIMSHHARRLLTSCLVFAIFVYDYEKTLMNFKPPEFITLTLSVSLLTLIISDLIVRYFIRVFSAVFQAFCLSFTAFVIVDTTLELVGLEAIGKTSKLALLSRRWEDLIPALIGSSGSISSETRFAVIVPPICAIFCASAVVRALFRSGSPTSLIISHDLLGLYIGVNGGLWIWAKSADLKTEVFCPSLMAIAFAALLVRISLVIPTSIVLDSLNWHMVYWRKKSSPLVISSQKILAKHMMSDSSKAATVNTNVITSKTQSLHSSAKLSSTNQIFSDSKTTSSNGVGVSNSPTSVVKRVISEFICGTDPVVRRLAMKAMEAENAADSYSKKLKEVSGDEIAKARGEFNLAIALGQSVKIVEELFLNARNCVENAETEKKILSNISVNASEELNKKIKIKTNGSLKNHEILVDEIKMIEKALNDLKYSSARMEDSAIESLRAASIKVQGKKLEPDLDETKRKDLASELLRQVETLKLRRRKKSESRSFIQDHEITKQRLAALEGGVSNSKQNSSAVVATTTTNVSSTATKNNNNQLNTSTTSSSVNGGINSSPPAKMANNTSITNEDNLSVASSQKSKSRKGGIFGISFSRASKNNNNNNNNDTSLSSLNDISSQSSSKSKGGIFGLFGKGSSGSKTKTKL